MDNFAKPQLHFIQNKIFVELFFSKVIHNLDRRNILILFLSIAWFAIFLLLFMSIAVYCFNDIAVRRLVLSYVFNYY